jgi:hypothetical protein
MRTFVDLELTDPDNCLVFGATGIFSAMCTAAPAPVILYSANNVNDWCHGGGTDAPATVTEDDPEAYAEHWVMLLEEFVRTHEAALILVSPQHEWHAEQQGNLGDPETCRWLRPEWNRLGMEAWLADPPEDLPAEVVFVGDMQDEFKPHHPCCEVFEDVECDTEESWFLPEDGEPVEGEGDGWVHFGCDGAGAVAQFWLGALKDVLLNNEFDCE